MESLYRWSLSIFQQCTSAWMYKITHCFSPWRCNYCKATLTVLGISSIMNFKVAFFHLSVTNISTSNMTELYLWQFYHHSDIYKHQHTLPDSLQSPCGAPEVIFRPYELVQSLQLLSCMTTWLLAEIKLIACWLFLFLLGLLKGNSSNLFFTQNYSPYLKWTKQSPVAGSGEQEEMQLISSSFLLWV